MFAGFDRTFVRAIFKFTFVFESIDPFDYAETLLTMLFPSRVPRVERLFLETDTNNPCQQLIVALTYLSVLFAPSKPVNINKYLFEEATFDA